jgi:hypothetical protein
MKCKWCVFLEPTAFMARCKLAGQADQQLYSTDCECDIDDKRRMVLLKQLGDKQQEVIG